MNRASLIPWLTIALASGAAALAYEGIWLRRASLVLGGSAVASAVTLGVFMGGMGIGALLAGRYRGSIVRAYGGLELFAALWVFALPWLLGNAPPWLAALLPLPAAVALGATWPLLASVLSARQALALYAANTGGAVFGVVGTTFVLMPTFGVRTTELIAAAIGIGAAWAAQLAPALPERPVATSQRPAAPLLLAAFGAGLCVLGLEVLWMRLAATALGATVQTMGLVLAVFLVTVALGAELGRRVGHPEQVPMALLGLAVAAVLGTLTWGLVPYALGLAYSLLGPEWLWIGHALLALVWMAGAPLLSGMCFSLLLRQADGLVEDSGAWLYGMNTLGSTLGAPLAGLVLLPMVGPEWTVGLLLIPVVAAAAWIDRRPRTALLGVATLALGLAVPSWNPRLYAVGVHLKLADFETLDADSIQEYVDENWDLVFYEHGRTAAVAVGRSRRTGNVWLSINGKFDASTGEDMPTQELSARIPLAVAPRAKRVGIVGLASGVTAGTALEDARVERLDVFELEPSVVRASHHFDHVNGRPLDDPRTRLIVDDARAALVAGAGPYDVLISEPSNPWISGVSNLFTREYWALAKSRLAEDGVFCQWLQLYGMGPGELRALVRTFSDVFGDVWLYETIPGSDVLLIAGPPPTDAAPLPWTLDPDGVRRLGGIGWLNTDDHPRVEWNAPGWLYYDTAEQNGAQINAARR